MNSQVDAHLDLREHSITRGPTHHASDTRLDACVLAPHDVYTPDHATALRCVDRSLLGGSEDVQLCAEGQGYVGTGSGFYCGCCRGAAIEIWAKLTTIRRGYLLKGNMLILV